MKTKYVLTIVAHAAMTSVSYADWKYPHGDSANTGFAKLVTAPAVRPMQFAQVGELASGAGPGRWSRRDRLYRQSLRSSLGVPMARLVEPAAAQRAVGHVLACRGGRRFGLRGSGNPFPH